MLKLFLPAKPAHLDYGVVYSCSAGPAPESTHCKTLLNATLPGIGRSLWLRGPFCKPLENVEPGVKSFSARMASLHCLLSDATKTRHAVTVHVCPGL